MDETYLRDNDVIFQQDNEIEFEDKSILVRNLTETKICLIDR